MAFKILSLDGGGFRGVISGRLLQEVETVLQEKRGQSLHDYFDLIAGTSTGSLLAAGVALKMDTKALLEVYEKRGKDIFPKWIRWQREWRRLSQFFGIGGLLYPHGAPNDDPKKQKVGLSTVIRDSFGDRTIESIGEKITTASGRVIEKPILLVLAYDTLSRGTSFFASNNPQGDARWYDRLPVWQLCTASASAPTFFPPYNLPYYQEETGTKQGLPHIDGGVSANNPTLAAISHALRTAESDLNNIFVLSIGTGKATEPFTYKEVNSWGQLGWIKNLAQIFLDPASEIDNAISSQILNIDQTNERHLRLDFQLDNHFLDRSPDVSNLVVRTINKEPTNKYLNKKVSEDIDDPTKYDEFIEVAEAYLKDETITFNGQNLSIKEAIAHFIDKAG